MKIKVISWKIFFLCLFVLYGGIVVNADEQTWDLTDNFSSSSSESSVVWSADNVTMVLDKAESYTAANNYLGGIDGHTRVYLGQTMSFIPADNVEISSIKLTSTSNVYANKPMTWYNAKASVENTVITVKPENKTSAVSVTFKEATRFTEVVVTYSVTKTVSSISLSGNYPTTFYVDDTFSYEGIVVTASFDDNSTADVTQKATFSIPDLSFTGTKTVTVSYRGQSADYTITVKEKPSYNISFSENGTVSEPVEYVRGETIVFPEITPPEGYTFMGWTTAEVPVQQAEAPELVNTSTAKAFGNTTYYAVYAVKSGETAVSYEDVLTRDVTGITGTNYSSFLGKKVKSDAEYAGNCAGGNSSIQLRSTNNNSGIVSTISGGKVKKVQVTWNSNTASGRTLVIYGSNTAYNSASDLYEKDIRGEQLGSIVCGTSTELIIDGDFAYIGMRSSSGAVYLAKIIIAWDSNVSTYSNYCTLVSVPTVDVSVSSVGYSTLYYGDRALKVPVGVTATTYSVNGNTLTESKVYEAGTIIPAGEAVVIKASAGTYEFAVSTASATKDERNSLRGSDEAEETTGGTLYYALTLNKQNDPKSVGFYWMNETGTAFTNGAHKAYLALDGSLGGGAQAKSSYLFSEVTTGINGAENVAHDAIQEGYNLNGQRVSQGYRGIVIVNGRKYIAK